MSSDIPRALLIVEDQPIVLACLQSFFEHAGFEVTSSESGAEALLAATLQPIHAALVDYELPDMNGINLISALTTSGVKFPIILVSGHGLGSEIQAEAFRAGAAAFLPKGVGVNGIFEKLQDLLATNGTERTD